MDEVNKINKIITERDYIQVLFQVLGTMILLTIIGNVFVIAAIILEKNLHSVANYLITSLAGYFRCY